MTRFYLLSTHYRSPIEFSLERLQEAGVAYQRLRTPLERAGAWTAPDGADSGRGARRRRSPRRTGSSTRRWTTTSTRRQALGHLFDLARAVNRALDEGGGADAIQAARVLYQLGSILGLFWKAPAGESWPQDVLDLAKMRDIARQEKNWKLSDELRNQLSDKGVVVEDGPQGQNLKRK